MANNEQIRSFHLCIAVQQHIDISVIAECHYMIVVCRTYSDAVCLPNPGAFVATVSHIPPDEIPRASCIEVNSFGY